MEILKFILTFFVGFGTILIGDYIWLGTVVKQFIIREFGSLITVTNGSIDIRLGAGLLAWSAIALMVLIFVTKNPNVNSIPTALGYGALMGGLMYAMYDLTNLTFLKNYSVAFTVVDIAWGVFLCSMISLTMFVFSRWINTVL
jgi:uncharacterized membrane protein